MCALGSFSSPHIACKLIARLRGTWTPVYAWASLKYFQPSSPTLNNRQRPKTRHSSHQNVLSPRATRTCASTPPFCPGILPHGTMLALLVAVYRYPRISLGSTPLTERCSEYNRTAYPLVLEGHSPWHVDIHFVNAKVLLLPLLPLELFPFEFRGIFPFLSVAEIREWDGH